MSRGPRDGAGVQGVALAEFGRRVVLAPDLAGVATVLIEYVAAAVPGAEVAVYLLHGDDSLRLLGAGPTALGNNTLCDHDGARLIRSCASARPSVMGDARWPYSGGLVRGPLFQQGRPMGLVDVATPGHPSRAERSLVREAADVVAVTVAMRQDQVRIRQLLAESRARGEALREANLALDRRARELTEQQAVLEATLTRMATQSRRFAAVVDSLVDGLVVVDGRGHAVYMNPRFLEVVGRGLPTEGFVRAFLALPLTRGDLSGPVPDAEHPLTLALAGRAQVEREVWVELPGAGEPTCWSLTTTPFVSEGTDAQVALLVRDITARKASEVASLRKQDELEQFAYVASHDLKAPLRHIRGFADLILGGLRRGDDAKPLVSYAERVVTGAVRMDETIQGLLRFAQAGGRALVLEDVNLSDLVEEVWEVVRGPGVPSEALAQPVVLGVVRGDAARLRQVFQNLLGNAVKFRHPDRALAVVVRAVVVGPVVRVSVSDNGIGVATEALSRIFLVFRRLHARDRYEGEGIGLAVCKKLVALHGGRITAHSDGTSGTAFVVELPHRRA